MATPAIVIKGSAGAAEHDAGLSHEGELRAHVHALEKLLPKAKGDKEKHTEQVKELYLKIKAYSLADARPGAQCVGAPPATLPARMFRRPHLFPAHPPRLPPALTPPGQSWWQRPRPCWQMPRRPFPRWSSARLPRGLQSRHSEFTRAIVVCCSVFM
jgi:hypothetical protein